MDEMDSAVTCNLSSPGELHVQSPIVAIFETEIYKPIQIERVNGTDHGSSQLSV